MTGFNDVLAIALLLFVFYLLGFRIVRRSREHEVDQQPDVGESASDLTPLQKRDILLEALNQPPYTEVLSPRQRERLRYSLLNPGATWTEPAPVGDFEESQAEVTAQPATPPAPAFEPATSTPDPTFDYQSEQTAQPGTALQMPGVAVPELATQPKPPRTPVIETIRASWDPAVMMLYLGALLVVVAGLIFATYNWGTLGGWQKLGMLAAGTGAFLLAGLAIRNFDRVKPASTTFIIIGGLLVPANFLAAYTVFDDVQPAMPLLLGAITTTVVHAFLSYQPGARIFRYSTVGAALVAIAVVPAALGFDAGWGGVLGLAVIALVPDHLFGINRFRRAWTVLAPIAAGPLALFALWHGWQVDGWMVVAALIGASVVATRLSHHYASRQPYLLAFADFLLILASVQVAHSFAGDRWVVAAFLLAFTLALLKRASTWPSVAYGLHFAAAFVFAAFVGEVTRELWDLEWALAAGATALTIGMLMHSRLHRQGAWVSEFVAAWALPVAVASGISANSGTWWWLPIGSAVLTMTLVMHRIRHRRPGDISLAIASVAGVVAVTVGADLLSLTGDARSLATLLIILAVLLTAIANLVLPQFRSVTGWLKNLLRLEVVVLFAAAGAGDDSTLAALIPIFVLTMFWNIWAGRASFWSLPMGVAFWIAMVEVLIPASAGPTAHLWWYVGLAAVYSLIAWQLDRRSIDPEDHVHAGAYLWSLVVLTSGVLAFFVAVLLLDRDSGIHSGVVLAAVAGLHWIGFRSTGNRLLVGLASLLMIAANIAWIAGDVSSVQYAVLAMVAAAIAAALYWWTSAARVWLAFIALVLASIYLQLATDLSYTQDLRMALVVAWVLVSVAIARWRSPDTIWQSRPIFTQAMLLHPLALILPLLDGAEKDISRPDLVLVLVSLAGVVATFGSLRRSRELVLVGSAFGMSALMLQINIGSPGNVHAYTVPLSIYLLAAGLLLRRDARIANALLAAGSAMLVVPAMIEALTTGEIVWLWVALAESIGLFLFGTVLRLRIPTAAGVIAVSVILLRMLVFAVSVLASWISVLSIGLALLLIGTMWLMFRDAIQTRTKAILQRWQRFD